MTEQYISLKEATQHCPYSQDYLKLRARQGKLKAIKIGRNWFTTKAWLEEYLNKFSIFEPFYGWRKRKLKVRTLATFNYPSKPKLWLVRREEEGTFRDLASLSQTEPNLLTNEIEPSSKKAKEFPKPSLQARAFRFHLLRPFLFILGLVMFLIILQGVLNFKSLEPILEKIIPAKTIEIER